MNDSRFDFLSFIQHFFVYGKQFLVFCRVSLFLGICQFIQSLLRCFAVRIILLVITGRGLHSKDNVGRLYHAVGEYLSLECTINEFNIAHRAVCGAYVVEVFKGNQTPHPPSEREAWDIVRSH